VAALVAALQAKADYSSSALLPRAGTNAAGSAAMVASVSSMWDNTLLVFSSDNGGCVKLSESGSTNYPLRGGNV